MKEIIKSLIEIAKYEKALALLFYQQVYENEGRSWEDLTQEERDFRLKYAGDIIKVEHPEVAAVL